MVEVTVVVVMTTVEPVWNTTGIRTAATRCSSASCGRADAQAEANRQAKAISTDVCCILVQAELQSLSIKSTTKLQLSCCTCKPVVCTSSQKVHQVIKVQQKKIRLLTFTSIGTILSNWIDWPDHLNSVQRTGSFLAKLTSFRRTNESLLRI